jgi:hypothetical protein
MERFAPTLAPDLRSRLESLVIPSTELGGHWTIESQRRAVDLVVDRIATISAEAAERPQATVPAAARRVG